MFNTKLNIVLKHCSGLNVFHFEYWFKMVNFNVSKIENDMENWFYFYDEKRTFVEGEKVLFVDDKWKWE